MIQRYDTSQQKRVPISQIRRHDGSNWVDVSFVRRYDTNLNRWVDCLNEYEFLYYAHETPGGAVESISADGSMVTITVPANNLGGSSFEFESKIPSSAIGKDLTLSFTLNASSTKALSSGSYVQTSVACRSWGLHAIGDYSGNGNDMNFSYTVDASAVEDRVKLVMDTNNFFSNDSTSVYSYVIKNVLVNGKPCKFNFQLKGV